MSRNARALAQDILPAVVLVAMIIAFAYEMIWEGKVPFYRDLGLYFYPIRFSLAQSFGAGELPLWDRHMATGFPLLADFQSGVFYPPHLLFFFLPFFTAIGTLFVFHYFIAAIGSYLLCRYWKFPAYLALLGAALFIFGGLIVSLTNVLNHFQSAVWLPWVILSLERALRSRSWKPLLVFVLVLSFQFLAGSPEIYAMTLGLAFLDGLTVKREEGGRAYKKLLLTLVGANALVAGLTMVQLLPTLELFRESRAQARLPYSESALWSLHPVNLINIFFLDKQVDTDVHNGLKLIFLKEIPFLLSYYTGAITLLGVALWLVFASYKERLLLLSLVAVSLLLAMGSYTPVYGVVFRYFPVLRFFRFPEKFFFITYALLLYGALKGLFWYLHEKDSAHGRGLGALSVVTVIVLGLYLFIRFDTLPLSRFIAWVTETPLFSTATVQRTSLALVAVERQMILMIGICLLFFLWKKGKIERRLFECVLVLVVFVDLSSAHRPYQFVINPHFVDKQATVLQPGDAKSHRVFYYPGVGNLHPNYYRLDSKPSFAELSSIVFNNLLPNTGVLYGFDYMQEIDALRRWPYLVFLEADNMPPDQLYRLLGVMNVKYLIAFIPLSGDGISLVHHFAQYPSWLYRLERTVPRVYVVPKTSPMESDLKKLLDRMSRKPFDPLKEVILDKPVDLPPQNGFQGHAEIIRYTNRQVSIRASLNGPGVLVLADSFYPGWRVYVDGKEERILRANLFFRGVSLPRGEHLVEFRYEPRSFMIGLAISLATLSGLAIFFLAPAAWKRRLYLPFAL